MPLVADPAVVLHQVSKSFAGKTAVERVSFVVPRGGGFALTGANGAGKSTVLKMVHGALHPSSGTLRVDGVDVVRSPEAVRRVLGIVPQEDCLDPDLSVRDNLLFHARYARMPPESAAVRIDSLLATLGLQGRGGDTVHLLSGGLRRRLVLARALLTNPAILVLDEPTRSLDEEGRRLFLEMLLERKGEGTTLLLATHDREEAELLCDRVATLREGRIVTLETARPTPAEKRRPVLTVLAGGAS